MEVQQVKDILTIKNDKHDVYLTAVLPLFEEKIKKRANNRFLNKDGTEELPVDLQHTLAKWIEWDMNTKAGLESRRMGDVSYNYDNEMPDFVKRDIAPHRKLRFV
ncbi:phage head-tail connector protein [Priestia flexa]|uniref:phage head-tail connector protein n=1 Tax=Priestia flexa TaxID=86664 RepID=UPI001CFD1770|nr:phage head-tail connector protein [Priestia flexa]